MLEPWGSPAARSLLHSGPFFIDTEDNEFVIGLVSRDLYPLSHLVQAMRKTRQTSEFITKMGPFFVGRVTHRNG